MQGALRIGRLGGLTVYLNYTWIFASVLILWWVALLRLPEEFPAWSTTFYWTGAVLVLALYFLSVIAHEWVHSALARTGPRSANLFPFGAAVPFRLGDAGPARAIVTALGAPLFNLMLGGVLLLVAGALPEAGGPLGWFKAMLMPLGWLNVGLGALNLIPGTPFDGGLALAGAQYSFSGDREGGQALVQSLGRVATLLLVLVGAWRGLASDQWLQALALVVVGWSAREAGAVGQQRRTLRDLLSQLSAADFMEVNRAQDAVSETGTVADLVREHPRFPPSIPLPVVDASGEMVGVVTVGAAERLLQGTWATTPVRAITTPASALQTVTPSTPLVDVLAIARHHGAGNGQGWEDEGAEEAAIPVVQGGRLLGSIDPMRLQTFSEASRQAGMQEAFDANGAAERGGLAGLAGLARSLGALLPALIVLVAMAILGNIALRTDPVDLQDVAASPESSVQFSNFRPAEGDIVGLGKLDLSVQVEASSPVVSATVILDDVPLETALTGSSPLTQTASATVEGLVLGQHTVLIRASTEDGGRKSTQWRFRVGSQGSYEPTAEPAPGAGAGAAQFEVVRYRPSLGGRVLAGEGDLALSVEIRSPVAPESARILLDGKKLDSQVEPVGGADNTYRVSATGPAPLIGQHTARVEVASQAAGSHSASWTFSALQPDDNNAYFKETGHFVGQPFLRYWQENDGLGLFGYPISDVVHETDEVSGEVYAAQYFERARFEQHPSLGAGVVLGRLGALLHEPEPAAAPKDGAQFFPETGHNVSPAFLRFWNDNGGLAVFGYPITEERVEANPIDGKEYTVQYFERNRFELHPEKAGTPFEVQLGLLGTELYRQKYGP